MQGRLVSDVSLPSCDVVESRAVLFMSLAQIPSRVVSIFRVILGVFDISG